MKKRWITFAGMFTVLLIAFVVARLLSPTLKLERTVIAELPKGINRLVKTDLDGDGEIELATACWADTDSLDFWINTSRSRSNLRLWLIRSPLTNPHAMQLEHVFGMDLPHNSPPLKELLVQDYKTRYLSELKRWLGPRLGWLRMRNGQIHFEPFAEGEYEICLLPYSDSMVLVFSEILAAPKNPHRFDFFRSHRKFAFRLQPDGTWKPIDSAKVKPLPDDYHQNAIGDFDGDGLADIVFRDDSVQMVHPPLTVGWGNGSPPTSLPFASKFYATDVENDGRWEIVTLDKPVPNRWDLNIWQFRPDEQRFVTIARLKGIKVPSQFTQKLASGIATAVAPSRPTSIEPIFEATDLNSDGQKDFFLLWTVKERIECCAFRVIDFAGVQVIYWQGKNLRMRSFSPNEVESPKTPVILEIFDKHRLAVVTANRQRLRFAFRLLSFRPLRVQFWKKEEELRNVIFKLPKGEDALDLRLWKKLAELPGRPLELAGDWDEDGKLDLLLMHQFLHEPIHFPFFASSRSMSDKSWTVLYIAHVDGCKVLWKKFVPPMPLSFVYALPVREGNNAALFVLWRAKDKVLLERIRWRTFQ